MLALLKKILFALVVLALVVFGYQNAEILSQKTHFMFDLYAEGYRYETPKFPVVLLYGVFFLLGMLLAGFHGIYERIARKAEVRKREKRVRALEKENEQLRKELAELRPPEGSEQSPRVEQEGEGEASSESTPARQLEAPGGSEQERNPTL